MCVRSQRWRALKNDILQLLLLGHIQVRSRVALSDILESFRKRHHLGASPVRGCESSHARRALHEGIRSSCPFVVLTLIPRGIRRSSTRTGL